MGLTIIIGLLGAIWMTRENLLEEAQLCRWRKTHVRPSTIKDFLINLIACAIMGFIVTGLLSFPVSSCSEKLPPVTSTYELSPLSKGHYIETVYVQNHRDVTETPMIRYIAGGKHLRKGLGTADIHLNADSPRLEEHVSYTKSKLLNFLFFDYGTSTYDLYTPESQIEGDFLITE